MNRTLKAKRIYVLGQFQNIELADEITDIPEKLAMDDKFVSLMTTLQLLNLERRANAYYAIREKYREASPEEAIALIEDEIAQTKLALNTHITKEGE